MNSKVSLFKSTAISMALVCTSQAQSIEIHGVEFPASAVIEECELVLNGTATRTAWGLKIYIVGLFLCERNPDEASIMDLDRTPKRVHISMLRGVGKEQFVSTIQDNIDNNFTVEERDRYAKEIAAFFACFDGGSDLTKGSVVTIDFLPGKGMIVGVNDQKFEAIAGDDFYHAILRLWIGKPPQKTIKEGLLGKIE